MAWAGYSTAMIIGHEEPAGVINTFDDVEYMVLNLTNISEKQLEEFFKGETVDLVLECPEGFSLPFHLSLKGEYLSLEPADQPAYSLKILKTCFIKCLGETFLFSDDWVCWHECQDFFTGSIGFSLKDSPQLEIQLQSKI